MGASRAANQALRQREGARLGKIDAPKSVQCLGTCAWAMAADDDGDLRIPDASGGEARVSEALFRGFFEAAPDAVVIVDAQGIIVLLLGQWVELLVPRRFRGSHPAHRNA